MGRGQGYGSWGTRLGACMGVLGVDKAGGVHLHLIHVHQLCANVLAHPHPVTYITRRVIVMFNGTGGRHDVR